MEENTNVQTKNATSLSLWMKLLIIFFISLLLLIPQFIVQNMITERSMTNGAAMYEVTQKWGTECEVFGPVLFVPGVNPKQSVYIMPEEFGAQTRLNTQLLNRGIFDISVYNAPVTLEGSFALPRELDPSLRSQLDFSRAQVLFAISDFKGFVDYPSLSFRGEKLELTASDKVLAGCNALSCPVDVSSLLAGGQASFRLDFPVKGSGSISIVPVGRSTDVQIASNCTTPSFSGGYLPAERDVADSGFSARWRVLALNRDFPQVLSDQASLASANTIQVDLKAPVEQYQKTTRTSKYAYLIILLTFAVVFLVEQRRRTPIHPVQYGLVGIALVLFYTLLLSFTEHVAFGLSYFIASVMTVGLISAFIFMLTRHRGAMLAVGGLLSVLYAFIFMLMQMESYALLVGSMGVFVVLALAMYASQKVRWY